MKIFIVFSLCFFAFCTPGRDKRNAIEAKSHLPPSNVGRVDSPRIKYLIWGGFIMPTTLALNQDSLILIEVGAFGAGKSVYTTYSGFDKDSISHTSGSLLKAEAGRYLGHMHSLAICIKNAGTVLAKESIPDSIVRKVKEKGGLITQQTRIHQFNRKYYFTEPGPTTVFYVFNPAGDSLLKLSHEQGLDIYINLIDFLLFDLSGDGNPEVIVFSDRDVPREGVITLGVFAIGNKPV